MNKSGTFFITHHSAKSRPGSRGFSQTGGQVVTPTKPPSRPLTNLSVKIENEAYVREEIDRLQQE